jgi:tetratricopeptide (TPR) repeat protein
MGDPEAQTVTSELADLRAALTKLAVKPEERDPLVEKYRGVRLALRRYAKPTVEWIREQRGDPKGLPSWMDAIRPPAGIPAEFADYLRGAIAYHLGRFAEARAAWEGLLRRPKAERHYRSTWAAYMIGRSLLDGAPEQAAPWLDRVGSLAREGFADTLGLAAASLGWKARAHLSRREYDRAIEVYLSQLQTGDPSAPWSIHLVAGRAFQLGPEMLQRLAAHPPSRRVLTAFLVAHGGPPGAAFGLPARDRILSWLKAVETAAATEVEGADRLAWVAYQSGEMEMTRRWLERARADAPMVPWLRAKLALRDGNLEAAARLLAQAVRGFPPGETWPEGAGLDESGYYPVVSPHGRALGELGGVRLSRREFVDALDALARADFWMDAAYVAERVLTVEELRAYVDRAWPEPSPSPPKRPGGPLAPLGTGWTARARETATKIRHLLARRLARLGRQAAARAYYPPQLRPTLDGYLRHLGPGQDAGRPAPERAASLFEAARIARRFGLEILGTEVEPDWAFLGADFELEAASRLRAGAAKPAVLPSSPEERDRLAQHRVEPEKRFHYRYVAAEIAWKAAALLPNNREETARILCVAGSWLKYRDPPAADRYYKAMVRRNRKTALGQLADGLRWFPARCGP